jgi:RNA polymerase sigma-70 factor (ECF subfamily)
MPPDVDAALTRVAREEGGRVLALLARRFGDLDLADEAVQDALVEAARTWPDRGVPDNPAAWLLSVARRRAVDRLRRTEVRVRNEHGGSVELRRWDDGVPVGAALVDAAADDDLPDERLRLLVLCCHPALDPDAQVALTLRLVGGLTTPEIAAAFLVPEATLAQRIVRSKRKIRDAGIPLSIPADLDQRVPVILGVLYLVFNEGYLSHGEGAAQRVDLADEAIRLTALLRQLLPDHAEVTGLLALELFHRARSDARTGPDGRLVRLEDQDRTRWDLPTIRVANRLLAECLTAREPGPYQLQAYIASLHANARTAADTDWPAIVTAYDQLLAVTGSPVVRLNRCVAVAMADGTGAGLAALAEVDGLEEYHLLHATRAELLARSGQDEEASQAFARARDLAANPAERRHLEQRRAALGLA